MANSSTDATNDYSQLKEALHSLYSQKIEGGDAVMGRDQMVRLEYEVLVNLYIVCKRMHQKKPEPTLSFAFELDAVPGEEKESNLFNALLEIVKKHDSNGYPDEAEVHALQALYYKMEAPLRQKLVDLTTCKGYDFDKFHYNNYAEDEETDDEEARVTSDDVHDEDGALEEKNGGSEVNELNEINHESHDAISKDLPDKVDMDGNVHEGSDVVKENSIKTEVNKDKDAHPARGNAGIHDEHGILKECDFVENKDCTEVTNGVDVLKIN